MTIRRRQQYQHQWSIDTSNLTTPNRRRKLQCSLPHAHINSNVNLKIKSNFTLNTMFTAFIIISLLSSFSIDMGTDLSRNTQIFVAATTSIIKTPSARDVGVETDSGGNVHFQIPGMGKAESITASSPPGSNTISIHLKTSSDTKTLNIHRDKSSSQTSISLTTTSNKPMNKNPKPKSLPPTDASKVPVPQEELVVLDPNEIQTLRTNSEAAPSPDPYSPSQDSKCTATSATTCKYDENESSQSSSNNNKKAIRVPRYFSTIPSSRITSETRHFQKNGQWRQRVILEILYHQILGENIDTKEDLDYVAKILNQTGNHHKSGSDTNNYTNNSGLSAPSSYHPSSQYDGAGNNNSNSISNNVSTATKHNNKDRPMKVGLVKHPTTSKPIPFKKEFKLSGWTNRFFNECEWEGIGCGKLHLEMKQKRKQKREMQMNKNYIEKDNHKVKKGDEYQNVDEDDFLFSFQLESKRDNCFCVESDFSLSKIFDEYDEYDDDDNYDEDEINSFQKNKENSVDGNEEHMNNCDCEDGYIKKVSAPELAVTHIILDGTNLIGGALPTDIANLPFLQKLIIKDNNKFIGTLPSELGKLKNLNEIHLEGLIVVGDIPSEWSMLNRTLEGLTLRNCHLQGTIPDSIMSLTNLVKLDLSMNDFSGSIPIDISKMDQLSYLDLGNNALIGTIPSTYRKLTNLRYFHLNNNHMEGSIPRNLSRLSSLQSLNLEHNWFSGPILQDIEQLDNLKILKLGMNKFSGSLPQKGWENLRIIDLGGNTLTGTIPINMFSTSNLQTLDLSRNKLHGTLPEVIETEKSLSKLIKIDLADNILSGSISILHELPGHTSIGITKNMFTGEIKEKHCKKSSDHNLDIIFNCTDLIACPAGTFHENGFANHISGCVKCPVCSSEGETHETCKYLGQTQCIDETVRFLRGDLDGDGSLSPREFLRLFNLLTEGNSWGENYSDWTNLSVHECTLSGINCKGGKVTKIDLRGANLCMSATCEGIPYEIEVLSDSIEVLDLSGSFSRHVSIEIPSSIGQLSSLKILDLSDNLVESIPDEIGNLSSLQILNLAKCRGIIDIPHTLWNLRSLEKLNLNENTFFGKTLPSELGMLTNLRELLISRSNFQGTIPKELGNLSKLKNLELNGNFLTGTVPSSFENFTLLKRLDIYSNHLEGSINFLLKIPEFEVIHLSMNRFSGTIPSDLGKLQKLTWLDLSLNSLTGEIPSSLATIPVLKDLHLGGNKLQPPIPSSLCENSQINGGSQNINSCDHIACPLGTTSESGYTSSSKDVKCLPCDEEETTLHLGMNFCTKIERYDYFAMLEALFHGKEWKYSKPEGTKNECDLNMVECDFDGDATTLAIPLAGIQYDEKLFQG